MNYTILLDKLYHTYILKSSNHYLNTDLQPEFFQVNRIVHICEPISISSARRSTVKLSLQAMRIKQFLLHFKTYGYQVYCIIGHYLEDNQPFSKTCKGTITTMYQVLVFRGYKLTSLLYSYSKYIYCKPSFIRLQEIFARASSLRIFLAANRSLLYGCNGISSGNKAYSWKIVTCKNQLPCVYQNREIKLSLIKVGFYSTCTNKNRMCYEITVIILIHNYINKKIIKIDKYLIYLFIIITPFVYSISDEYFIIRTWTIHTKSTINYNP